MINASHIIQAMLSLGYESPISVELETLDIWLGDENDKKTLTEIEIQQIHEKAKDFVVPIASQDPLQ